MMLVILPGLFWPAVVVAAGAVILKSEATAFAAAFFGGLTADLIQGRTMGISAIMLLCLVLAINLLKLRFQNRFWVAVVPVIMFEVLYRLISYGFRI